MTRFAILLGALAACVHSNKVVCGDLTCPPDYTCDAANDRCISPDQIAACANAAEGADCVVDMAPGVCRAGACNPLVCGDGIVSGAEQCDGTNFNGANCQTFHFYNADGLACNASCELVTTGCTGFCGDGQINGGELCDGAPPPLGACFDFGYDAGPLGCSDACGASFESCARIGWHIEPLGAVVANGGAASSDDDGWIVGDNGVIEHFNGVVWSAEASPVTNTLVAVTAIAPNDAWAVGIGTPTSGVVLRRDASGWNLVTGVPAAAYNDVWAAAHDQVFVATNNQGVLEWDGTGWTTVGTLAAQAKSVRGTSANDLWVIRGDGALEHWDGQAWSPATISGNFDSIAVVARDDVWAVGLTPSFNGLIAHWDGTAWTSTTNPFVGYAGVAASGPKDVWVAMSAGDSIHFDGSTWASVPITFDQTNATIISLGPDEAFAFTTSGFAYRYTGQAFANYSLPTLGPPTEALWSSSGTDLYVAAGSALYRYDGTSFVKEFVEPNNFSFQVIAGDSASNIWTLANSGSLFQFDGTSWTAQTPPNTNLDPKIWVGDGQVWMFAQGNAYQGPGTWIAHTVPGGSWASVSGDAANDIWGIQADISLAVAFILKRWDGTSWQTMATPRDDLVAVGVRAASDVFISTKSGHMLHWDGAAWSDTVVTTLHPLTWIVPIAHDDVFAASDLDIVHFDGTRWSRVRPDRDTTAPGNTIVGVTSPSPAHFQFAYEQLRVRDLIRTRPWVCRASETNCNDSIDDDCDGKIDGDDSDCP